MNERKWYIAALIGDLFLAASSLTGVLTNVFRIYFMINLGRMTSAPFFSTFTGLSNTIIGVLALLSLIFRLAYKKRELPSWLFLTKLIATALIAITFLITALVLAPNVGEDWWRLYINGSLFNHLLTPLIAVACFMVFEKRSESPYRFCLLSLLPMGAYIVFYFARAFSNVGPDGAIDPYYDIYGMAQFGIPAAIGLAFAFLALSLALTSLLYLQNHRKKNPKEEPPEQDALA